MKINWLAKMKMNMNEVCLFFIYKYGSRESSKSGRTHGRRRSIFDNETRLVFSLFLFSSTFDDLSELDPSILTFIIYACVQMQPERSSRIEENQAGD